MKKCVVFFALLVLAIVAAAIIDNGEEQVELIDDVSRGEKGIENIVAHGGG